LSRYTPTSEVLVALAGGDSERLKVRDIINALRHKAFALLVVVLALPNCLPMPPPIPLLCGLLLAVVAVQMIIGLPTPWLPAPVLERSVARADFTGAVARALPPLRRLERLSRPRLRFFETSAGMRGIGAVLLAMALALLVAAPFVGQIPLGMAAALVGLGLVERDGAVVLAGMIMGAVGFSLSLGFVVAIISGVAALV
jgi:hypothetical protein